MVITRQLWIQRRQSRRLAAAAAASVLLLLVLALSSPPWQPRPYALDEVIPELVPIPDEIPALPPLAPEPLRPQFLPRFEIATGPEKSLEDPDLIWPDSGRSPSPFPRQGAAPFASVAEEPPRAVFRVTPEIPEFLREAGLEGRVSLEVTVGLRGEVTAVRVLSATAPSALIDAALRAARRWRYAPAHQGRRPVVATAALTFDFRVR